MRHTLIILLLLSFAAFPQDKRIGIAVIDLPFKLEHTKLYLDSIGTATKKVRVRNLIIRQVMLGTLAIGCFGGGYYHNGKLRTSVDEKNAAHTAYMQGSAGRDFDALWNDYQDAGKDIKRQQAYRNLLYGCAAAFTFGFGLSFTF